MQRNGTEDARNSGRRHDDEEESAAPEQVPNFLTADELKAREPARDVAREKPEKPNAKPAPPQGH